MRARIENPEHGELISRIRDSLCAFPPDASNAEAIWLAYNGLTSAPTCPRCASTIKFTSLKDGYNTYCSHSCAAQSTSHQGRLTKIANGTLADFGTTRLRQATMNKYGVEYAAQSQDVKDKIRQTMIDRHGVLSALALVYNRSAAWDTSSREKRRQTNQAKYGSDSPLGSSDIRAKGKDTLMHNYGVAQPMHSAEILGNMRQAKLSSWQTSRVDALSDTVTLVSPITDLLSKNHSADWKCVKCGEVFKSNLDDGKIPMCRACTPASKVGHKIGQLFLEQIGHSIGPCKINDRTEIWPYELDFFWPQHQLAVEVNGLYWHSELVIGSKTKDLDKLKLAENKNIRTLFLYEDEVRNSADIVKSIIHSIIHMPAKIYGARQLSVVKLSVAESREFCAENHLGGFAGGSIHLGLRADDGVLMAAMVIGKSRFSKQFDYEIIRFCHKKYHKIHGAFSKLFATAKDLLPNNASIVTYADKRLFTGAVYLKAGFAAEQDTGPGFWYTDYRTRENRLKYLRHKLEIPNDIATIDFLRSKKIDRIWDCGQRVFSYKITRNYEGNATV